MPLIRLAVGFALTSPRNSTLLLMYSTHSTDVGVDSNSDSDVGFLRRGWLNPGSVYT